MPQRDDSGEEDNSAPTDIQLSSSDAPAGGGVVGVLSAVDPDFGDTFTYTIVSQYDSSGNSTNTAPNPLFTLVPSLNQETAELHVDGSHTYFQYGSQGPYQVNVSVTDSAGNAIASWVSFSISHPGGSSGSAPSGSTGVALGDPYIKTMTDGAFYKLPNDNRTYRLWDNLASGGSTVINVRNHVLDATDLLSLEAWENNTREKTRAFGGVSKSASFLRYAWVSHEGTVACIDLETLEFVTPAPGLTWNQAANRHDAWERSPEGPFRVDRSHCAQPGSLKEVVPAYAHVQRGQGMRLYLPTETHGAVRLVCDTYPRDPQIRTGVSLETDRVVAAGECSGCIVARVEGSVKRLDTVSRLKPRTCSKRGRACRDPVFVRTETGEFVRGYIDYVK